MLDEDEEKEEEAKTSQILFMVPRMQFIEGRRLLGCDAEAHPGPVCSDDHRNSPATALYEVVDVPIEVAQFFCKLLACPLLCNVSCRMVQTLLFAVAVRQLQFFEGGRLPCGDAEADPHGPGCSEDHRDSASRVRTLETQCLGHLLRDAEPESCPRCWWQFCGIMVGLWHEENVLGDARRCQGVFRAGFSGDSRAPTVAARCGLLCSQTSRSPRPLRVWAVLGQGC